MKSSSSVFSHDLFKITKPSLMSLGTVQTLEEETKVGYSWITTSISIVFSIMAELPTLASFFRFQRYEYLVSSIQYPISNIEYRVSSIQVR